MRGLAAGSSCDSAAETSAPNTEAEAGRAGPPDGGDSLRRRAFGDHDRTRAGFPFNRAHGQQKLAEPLGHRHSVGLFGRHLQGHGAGHMSGGAGRCFGRRALGDLLVHRDHPDQGQHRLSHHATADRRVAALEFLSQDHVHQVARRDQAGGAGFRSHTDRHRPGAGAEHGGEEAAVARPQHVGLEHRRTGIEVAAQHGATDFSAAVVGGYEAAVRHRVRRHFAFAQIGVLQQGAGLQRLRGHQELHRRTGDCLRGANCVGFTAL